uniref:Uncharacterized protein n=1 Tax=Ascaris lumbricoides TaxID=6252 RepID=A0A0M3IJE2_ASCLU
MNTLRYDDFRIKKRGKVAKKRILCLLAWRVFQPLFESEDSTCKDVDVLRGVMGSILTVSTALKRNRNRSSRGRCDLRREMLVHTHNVILYKKCIYNRFTKMPAEKV